MTRRPTRFFGKEATEFTSDHGVWIEIDCPVNLDEMTEYEKLLLLTLKKYPGVHEEHLIACSSRIGKLMSNRDLFLKGIRDSGKSIVRFYQLGLIVLSTRPGWRSISISPKGLALLDGIDVG